MIKKLTARLNTLKQVKLNYLDLIDVTHNECSKSFCKGCISRIDNEIKFLEAMLNEF